MARLIRMDQTGHTTLAEWTAADPVATEAAAEALREQLDAGYYAVVDHGEGRAEQVRELPEGAELVILRRPIAGDSEPAPMGALPELAAVPWRPRMDAERLRMLTRGWNATMLAHTLPLAATALILLFLSPLTAPVGLILLAHAWAIPELYANRGAKVVKPRRRAADGPERTALGLLGDLVGHEARELHGRTGLVLERGALGVWLVGEAGALLVRSGGRRVHCWCVGVPDPELPSSDRIAHLLLALREDESGFATVANHAFTGARWRVRRRLPQAMRPALEAAAAADRAQRVRAATQDHVDSRMA